MKQYLLTLRDTAFDALLVTLIHPHFGLSSPSSSVVSQNSIITLAKLLKYCVHDKIFCRKLLLLFLS